VSIVTKPHIPRASEPSRDDDPTGVHALLSSLRHPDPMPDHLIERINASLAAEQAQRAARIEDGSVSPMVTRRPQRPARLVFAVAGAAAAVVLVAVVSSISFSGSQTTTTSIGAAVSSASSSGDHADEAAPSAGTPTPAGGQLYARSQPGSKATPGAASKDGFSGGESLSAAGVPLGVPAPQIRQSGTRYTQAGFLAQAVSLHQAALTSAHFQSATNVGPVSTTDWLRECMSAIGAAEIQLVEADVAFYDGRPAVIIVGMANGAPLAYVVTPQCSHVDPALLRPATSLS
jgi:hypothetical protein